MSVSDKLPSNLLLLLNQCGATSEPHTGRTLFEHLFGTYRLLQKWGNSPAICLAGLFHSIYGTNAFKKKSLSKSERHRLQLMIGIEAEKLAWFFCSINRPRAIVDGLRESFKGNGNEFAELDGAVLCASSMNVSPAVDAGNDLYATRSEIVSLAEIECANLIEQKDKSQGLRALYLVSVEQANVLSSSALSDVRQVLTQSLSKASKE
jgi:hypothetical protein